MSEFDQEQIGRDVSETVRNVGSMLQEGAGGILVEQPIFVFPGDSMGVRAFLRALDRVVPSIGQMRDEVYTLAGAMRVAKHRAAGVRPVALSEALEYAGIGKFAQVMANELALDSDGMISDEMILNVEAAVFLAELSMRLVAGAMLAPKGGSDDEPA